MQDPSFLSRLQDAIKSTTEHLQHAAETGDEAKVQRLHPALENLNQIAQEQIQQAQAQQTKLPGTDNGGPTGLMPQQSSPQPPPMPDMPPSNPPQEAPPRPMNPSRISQANPFGYPDSYTSPSSGSNAAPNGPSKPFNWSEAIIGGLPGMNAAAAHGWSAVMPTRPSEVGDLMKAGWENSLPGATVKYGPEVMENIQSDKPFNQWFQSPVKPTAEQAFGSQERANTIAQTLLPGSDYPETDYATEAGTKENTTLDKYLGGLKDRTQPSSVALAGGKYGSAVKPPTPEDLFNSRVAKEAGEKPSMFTLENLLALLFGGPHAALGKYQNESNRYQNEKSRIGSEIYKSQEGNRDRNAQIQINRDTLNLKAAEAQIHDAAELRKETTEGLKAYLHDLESRRQTWSGTQAMMNNKESLNQLNSIDAEANNVIKELNSRGVKVQGKR